MGGPGAGGKTGSVESEETIDAGNGEKIAATLAVPAGSGSGRWPAILLCQGLSGIRTAVMPELARLLAERGFASLRFDYLGCGDSDGEPGWVDPNYRTRQAALTLAWLIGREEIDPGRVGVYGHSYGGQTAISVAARDDRVRAMVAVSGPGSGSSLLRASRPGWDWITFKRELEKERGAVANGAEPQIVGVDRILPFSPAFMKKWRKLTAGGDGTSAMKSGAELPSYHLLTADRMLEAEPASDAARLGGCPLLMVNGADDDVVPIETVEPVYRAAPGPKRWIEVAGADHNTLDAGQGLAMAGKEACDWFETHLA